MLNDALERNKTVIVWFHKKHSSLVYKAIRDRFGDVAVEEQCLPDGRRLRVILKDLNLAEIIWLYVHFDTVFGHRVTDNMSKVNFNREKIKIRIYNRRAA